MNIEKPTTGFRKSLIRILGPSGGVGLILWLVCLSLPNDGSVQAPEENAATSVVRNSAPDRREAWRRLQPGSAVPKTPEPAASEARAEAVTGSLTGTESQSVRAASAESTRAELVAMATALNQTAAPEQSRFDKQPEIIPSPTDIRVLFKTIRRTGRRSTAAWMLSPNFSLSGAGGEVTVVVKAQRMDPNGLTVDISPDWIPSDPGMMFVSPWPEGGSAVTIKVLRAGQSKLFVASQTASKELSISAVQEEGVLRVEISQ